MNLATLKPNFSVSLAETEDDLRDAQQLRYDVFVRELGADGPGVDHKRRLETDRFDRFADHLLLKDGLSGELVGVYRIMTQQHADAAGGFYCESEYDIGCLVRSGKTLLELGRSCLRQDVRGSSGMLAMWSALEDYARKHNADLLFGVASLKGTDTKRLSNALSYLNEEHLAPAALRPVARQYEPMDRLTPEEIDRKDAILTLPPLLKSYLRLGAQVGDGAFVDEAFNCTDVCIILDAEVLNKAQARLFQHQGGL